MVGREFSIAYELPLSFVKETLVDVFHTRDASTAVLTATDYVITFTPSSSLLNCTEISKQTKSDTYHIYVIFFFRMRLSRLATMSRPCSPIRLQI